MDRPFIIAKKSFGQNFLMHSQTAERIVEAAQVSGEDCVLEVGPGTGMLTRVLLAKARKVVAVESDADLLPGLQEKFATELAEGKLELIAGDIRSLEPADMPALTGLGNTPETYKVVANIPYYITGELIRKFLTASKKPESITFLVQKEVAVRIARSKKESILSLSVKAFGKPSYCFTVPRGAFKPAPNVDSAVLRISDIASPFATKEEEEHFFAVLHAGFGQKRKQLANTLSTVFAPEMVAEAFATLSLSPNIRAEDLPLETWLSLSKLLQ